MAGLVPGFGPSYDATKHAVVALTEDLYLFLHEAGIPVGVSVLCPGWVRTQIVDAERNWPTHLGKQPDRSVSAVVIDPHLRRALDEGMTPAAVADIVATGIEEERFWLFTHTDWMPMAVGRWDSIAEGANPTAPEDVPGLPPRSQIVEEVLAAMAAAQDDT
jgi:NAD(P)-dependent dehydrogenase (short-subunit alcohol dehydrogenase family)